MEWPRRLAVFAYVVIGCWYFGYRFGTLNPAAPIFSSVVLGAELFGFTTTLLHFFMVWRMTERECPPPLEGRTVDVFIPTINEPEAIVRRTALKAMAMDYPHVVYILDDGRRPEIQRMAEELGCRYLTRPNNLHAKAGNLNHALAQSTGEFICLFDADHAPKHTFITKTLGFFADEAVAFVQTPQDFYNLDSYQHRGDARRGTIWTEQGLFFRIIQRGKDYWNAAFFCGSCAIIRRSSLEAVGGFATETVTEDLHTSIRLHKAGFKSVYIPDSLAFGIAAAQIEPFLSQRIRWGQGAMQVWRSEGILFRPGLTGAQKACYLASMITYFDGWQKLIMYLAPAVVLLMGWLPIVALDSEFFVHFIPYIILTFVVFEEVGRGFGNAAAIEQYNMARFAAFAWSTFGLVLKRLKFKVTNKASVMSGMNLYIAPQTLILIINALAIGGGTLLYMQQQHITPLVLAANSFWALINLILAYAVVAFTTLRSTYLRRSYRFNIPLVASFRPRTPHATMLQAAVRDVSSDGLLLQAPAVHHFRQGDVIDGELYLPHGTLPFQARITVPSLSGSTTSMQRIGCEFLWPSHDHRTRDTLESFLYGSDLEWRMQSLREDHRTPLEWLLGRFHEPHEVLPPKLTQQGLVAIYQRTGQASGTPALFLQEGRTGECLMAGFTAMNEGEMLRVQALTETGWREMRTSVTHIIPTHAEDDGIYCYRLAIL